MRDDTNPREVTALMWKENVSEAEARKRLGYPRTLCKHGMPLGCCAVCASERNRAEWEALAAITGRTIEELDADLTAPDPREEEA